MPTNSLHRVLVGMSGAGSFEGGKMSECVVRMEMPKCCEDCAAEYDCMACGITGTPWYEEREEFNPSNGRLPDCPIICSLQEGHGRLGDLDELDRKINGARIRAMQDGQDTNPYWECGDIIAQAKTIVPAERSET